jgi:hypothetical protein
VKAHCETCRGPQLLPDGVWSGCEPCEIAARKFERSARNSADSDHAYHELAHHVMLFNRLPHRKADWDRIYTVICAFSQGRAQIHELRVLALQFAVYSLLGWRPTYKRLVELSWGGINEVDDLCERGRKIVHTEAQARRRVAGLAVSPAKVRLYSNAVRQLRGEAHALAVRS